VKALAQFYRLAKRSVTNDCWTSRVSLAVFHAPQRNEMTDPIKTTSPVLGRKFRD